MADCQKQDDTNQEEEEDPEVSRDEEWYTSDPGFSTERRERAGRRFSDKIIGIKDENSKLIGFIVECYAKKKPPPSVDICYLMNLTPGCCVFYLGPIADSRIYRISAAIGRLGLIYAAGFYYKSRKDILRSSNLHGLLYPIMDNPRHPDKYSSTVGKVDAIFAEIVFPDQARIVALNAHYFLKNGGHFVILIKSTCFHNKAQMEAAIAWVKKLANDKLTPQAKITIDTYGKEYVVVAGVFKPPAEEAA